MISVLKVNGLSYFDNTSYMEGLSTDVKPLDFLPAVNQDGEMVAHPVKNCDKFLEIDTGTVFVFDEENTLWRSL